MSQPVRILIVDTAPEAGKISQQINSFCPSAIITRSNGAGAMALFKEDSPDLVILEMVMPDADGIELLRAMKQSNPHACIIAGRPAATPFRARRCCTGLAGLAPMPPCPSLLMSHS